MKEADFKRIVKEAIHETLEGFGFSVTDPLSVQDDMRYMRKMRLGCEATKRNVLKAAVTFLVPSGIYLIWEAFKAVWKQ